MGLTKAKGSAIDFMVGTMADLLTANKGSPTIMLGFHSPADGGWGIFRWNPTRSKLDHTGGSVIDDTRTLPTDWTNATQVTAWLTPVAGNGCWERMGETSISAICFGAFSDGLTSSLQQFIAAQAASTHIVYPEGTYLLDGKFSGLSNKIHEGRRATFKLADNTNDTMMEFSAKTNFEVSGIEFNGNKANQTIFGPLLGLYLVDCTNANIHDNVAYDVNGVGFAHNVLQSSKIVHNRAYNNADNGFDFNGDFTAVPRTNQGTIGNTITDNQSFNNSGDGFFIGHGITSNNTINDNISTGNGRAGYLCGEASSSLIASNTFAGNTFDGNIGRGNATEGAVFYMAVGNDITDNNLQDNGTIGLRISRVDAGQAPSKDNILTGNNLGNIVGSQAKGLLLDGGTTGCSVSANRISGNVTQDVDTTGAGVNNQIRDNFIAGFWQRRYGTTSHSIAAGTTDSQSVVLTGYNNVPAVQCTILATTGTEDLTVHADTLTAGGFNIRVTNTTGVAATCTVQWTTDDGYST